MSGVLTFSVQTVPCSYIFVIPTLVLYLIRASVMEKVFCKKGSEVQLSLCEPRRMSLNDARDSGVRSAATYATSYLPPMYLCMAQRKCESLSPSLSMNGFFLAGLKACFD